MANIQNSANYEKLKNVLKEVFQLDQADLDFGIYRIMNQKRNEINDFLEKRLLPQVTEILQSNGDGSNTKVQQELDKAIEQANSLGVDPESLPKVIELRKKLTSTTSVDSLEQEVYSHLANFFKRYYKDGDFISLRRYKKDVYAIPYEGEEVKLHWANHDQYYIKTSEYLKNYGFKLPNGKSVKFELKEASTEQNNNKEQSGKERRFQLFSELPIEVSEDGKTLVVNFTYEEHDKKVSQDKLNNESIDSLVKSIPQDFHAVLEKRPTDKNKNRTLLEKHIVDFTARNSFDYFIHKDLGGFLSRELDFYIKNEVLYLDDINTDNEQDFQSQLSKVKAIKQVAQKIITFLSQIENFQKKLWLKKKFVVSTNYCITLDRIPEKYYEEIVKNKSQLEEWKELFRIDKIQGDLLSIEYTEPLSIDFLKSQKYLVLDTKFFSSDFKESLLADFDNLDKSINGLLLNSDNFQGLNLLENKYKKNIRNIYIDPPYNTDASEIIYKNGYKHSSWTSLMNDRILTSKKLMTSDAIIATAIDHAELFNLGKLKDAIFNEENRIAIVAIQHNPKGRNQAKFFSENIEYMLVYANEIHKANFNQVAIDEEVLETFTEMDDKGRYRYENYIRARTSWSRKNRPNNWYPLYVSQDLKQISSDFVNGYTVLYPQTEYGDFSWKNIKSSFDELNKNDYFKASNENGNITIRHKYREQQVFKNLWSKKKHQSEFHGTNVLKDMMGGNYFDYPKSIYTVSDMIKLTSDKKDITLDYFAGSGTTGHAVLNLNREDNGQRKFVLIEMGMYFNSLTKPRVIKAIYTNNWKKGLPQDNYGVSSMVKYQQVESYEDSLNNLSLVKNKEQSSLLEKSDFNDEYMLSYMLDVEYKDSLLNIDVFKNPFNYKLNITRNNESQETVIDLVETFNYLIGLHVKTIQTIRGFKVITGITNERNEETLVIWRNTEEKSNQDLNEFFTKMEFSTRDSEFQRIYVNGDNHLENLKTGDDNWKVVLIEEEFMKRMFDVQDV